jgi:pyruvate/2-oxoglutarate dehydrogenase complex dihydrolipoamide acyltransferase (E2) component
MTGLFVVLQKGGDLQKAHVQAHFKRDPKTGKLIFIKDYDDTRHKHLVDKTFKAGHTVKIINPKSRHFGKMMEVTSYSGKYDTLRGKIVGSGETGDFRPHQVDHHDPAAAAAPATPPVAAPAPPAARTPAKDLSLDDAKQALGLLGLSYTSAEMAHEKKRVESMDAAKLAARVSKIRNAQKLYNFLRAIREWGDANKFGVADEIEKSLVQKAKDAQAAKTGVAAPPAAKPAEAAKPAPPPRSRRNRPTISMTRRRLTRSLTTWPGASPIRWGSCRSTKRSQLT